MSRYRNPAVTIPQNLGAGTYLVKKSSGDDILFTASEPITLLKPIVYDSAKRANSTTTVGNADLGFSWDSVTGTHGIIENKLYSVTDTSGDLLLMDCGRSDLVVSCIFSGQLLGTNQRHFNLIFHAADAQNFHMARISKTEVQLMRSVGGTISYLNTSSSPSAVADNEEYEIKIFSADNICRVYINGRLFINYTFTAGDVTLMRNTKVGIRLSKTGTPTGTARAHRFLVEPIV
ncbi:hypothetical protein [Paenibacillus gallinarum]|uniref:DUF1080 domain-containing protein n=1 Tax=Paenibacillus gallinarum TaxID=2762232 RepID=A0ABR8SW59_9BACL|nr:hypothetical protein [Paenibacillus gallinarum]MBD7967751.1 hypothetical protein [Paenibacillus gallinarum]